MGHGHLDTFRLVTTLQEGRRLEGLLILNRSNRLGDDVEDYVLPHSYKKEWWEWERAKDEF